MDVISTMIHCVLIIIYLGCGSGPLSHWEDCRSGGSTEGTGETIVLVMGGSIVGLSSCRIKICIDLYL